MVLGVQEVCLLHNLPAGAGRLCKGSVWCWQVVQGVCVVLTGGARGLYGAGRWCKRSVW